MKNNYWDLDLAYKGDRNYLHSTDIVFELFKTIGSANSIVFQFHKASSHPLRASYINESELAFFRAMGEMCVIASFVIPGGERKIIALVEDKKQVVSRRSPYNELEVVKYSVVGDNRISQKINNKFTFFDQISSLNKKLLNKLFGKRNWLLVRLDLEKYPVYIGDISIVFVREVGGVMYKSNIVNGNTILGCVFFSTKI